MSKFKYLKIFVLLIFAGLQLFLAPVYVEAIKLEPESAINLVDTEDQTVHIVSSIEEEASGVELRLSIEGGEFVNYQPPTTSGFLVIGTCGEDKSMSSSHNVCVDIVNTEGIEAGDDLGTISFKLTSERAVIRAEDNNRYTLTEGSGKVTNIGIAGEYSINATLQNENNIGTKNQGQSVWSKPLSFLTDAPLYFVFISAGIVLILVSVLLLINRQTVKKDITNEKQENN